MGIARLNGDIIYPVNTAHVAVVRMYRSPIRAPPHRRLPSNLDRIAACQHLKPGNFSQPPRTLTFDFFSLQKKVIFPDNYGHNGVYSIIKEWTIMVTSKINPFPVRTIHDARLHHRRRHRPFWWRHSAGWGNCSKVAAAPTSRTYMKAEVWRRYVRSQSFFLRIFNCMVIIRSVGCGEIGNGRG